MRGLHQQILFLVMGQMDVLKMFLRLLHKKQKVLTLSPTFAMYDVYPKIFDLKHSKFDYNFSKKGPELNLKKLLLKIKDEKPKLLCLANPNSPTGTILQMRENLKIN